MQRATTSRASGPEWVDHADEPEQHERQDTALGRWVATPLLAALVAVETADLIFALDSIPAITTDTFIVFASNAFALLGMRALYFMLAGAIERFIYLKVGLAIVLVFVGVKFIYSDLVGKVPVSVSLPVIAMIVGASISASLVATRPSAPEGRT